jgi:hypothetical protein
MSGVLNLLILRNSKTEKNHKNAEVRYTAGTRNDRRLWQNGMEHENTEFSLWRQFTSSQQGICRKQSQTITCVAGGRENVRNGH